MTTAEGMPIWYELLTPDPAAAERFYTPITGWTTTAMGSPDQPYRIWEMDGTGIGGLAQPQPEAPPGWLAYFHVADLDAKLEQVRALGGQVLMGRYDVPGVGAMALVADPQGAPFYLMTPASRPDAPASTSFDHSLPGRCAWNELATSNEGAALPFYGALLGWTSKGAMPMGPAGDYRFIDHGDQPLGAMMNRQSEQQPLRWSFYFKVPDAARAAEQVKAGGGTVVAGPMEVPGGQQVVMAVDPQGLGVGFVSGDRA